MAILHARALLTPDREVCPGTVAVDGLGRVVSVGVPAQGRPLQGVLVPGFVDVQCNGAAGRSLAEASPEAFDHVGRALLMSGTTSWCPTLPSAPPDTYPRFLDAAASARERPGPRILGVHLEGPFLNPNRRGAHDPRNLRAPDADWLETLLDRHPDLVRIVTLAPELPGALEVVKLCAGRRVAVSLGHSDATAEQATAAFDAGAGMLTHLFNAMRPIHHRDPGVAGAALARPDVRVGLICDGRHVDPSLAGFFARSLGPLRAAVVSDAVAVPSEGAVLSGGFELLDGALRNLLAWGLELSDVVRMLTRTPAEGAGVADAGGLEVGDRADAVLLRDGSVAAVWLAGERVTPA